jgi:hypothetical protein
LDILVGNVWRSENPNGGGIPTIYDGRQLPRGDIGSDSHCNFNTPPSSASQPQFHQGGDILQ